MGEDQHRNGHDTDGAEGTDYDDDEDEDEEEEDEEDEEPALKYERLGGSVHDLLLKDSASALTSSHQRLVSVNAESLRHIIMCRVTDPRNTCRYHPCIGHAGRTVEIRETPLGQYPRYLS